MKKKQIYGVWYGHTLFKTLRIMRLTLGLLLVLVVQGWATKSYSQKTLLNLNMKNAQLLDILDAIEKQTDYYFLFNYEQIRSDKKFDGQATNKKIDETLDLILKGTDLTYTIKDRQIIISKEKLGLLQEAGSDLQQQKSISGKVNDSSGTSLPGVSVVVKGTTIGIITDVEGNYSLANIPTNATLQFSFVGMKTQEAQVAGKTTINITLAEEAIGIDEVVAVGYGTQKRRDVTGSVASVKGDVLNEIPAPSLEQSLSGRAAGVQVISGSGTPGSGATIRVRGVGTLNNNEPLYVIDGIILGNIAGGGQGDVSPLSLINPNDIESVDILKDASATAIYGARAGNGAVIITTKRGKGDKLNVSYDGYTAVNKLDQSRYGMMTGPEWAQVYAKAQDNSGNSDYTGQPFVNRIIAGENIPTYDWVGELMQNGKIQSHNLSVSGGNEESNYFTSVSYFKQDGIVNNSDLERFTLRFNSDHKIGSKFKFGNTMLISRSNNNKRGNTYGFDNTTDYLNRVLRVNVYKPIYDPTGYYAGVNYHDPDAEGLLDSENSHTIWAVNEMTEFDAVNRLWTSLYGDLEIIDGLVFHTMGSVDYNTTKYHNYRPSNKIEGNMGSPDEKTRLEIGESERQTWFIENTLTYTKKIKDHNFSALLGYQSQNSKFTSFYALDGSFENTDYWFFNRPHLKTEVKDAEGNIIMTLPALTVVAGNNEFEESFVSLFGRLNYDYKGKYLLTATVRRDASSKFGPDYRWGTFPAMSVGWRISEEEFMKGISWLHNMKLRVGYGISGSDNVPNYQFTSEVGSEGEFNYVFNEGEASGATIARLANNALRWEEIKMGNIGLDVSLFKGRIDIVADVFDKTTSDLFLPYAPAFEIGMESNPSGNLGEVKNKGFELGIHSVNMQRKITWTTDFSFSTVKNEIVSLPQNADRFSNVNISRVGEEIGALYGYVADGIFQNWDEVYSHAYQNQAVSSFDENSMPIYDKTKTDKSTSISFTAPGDFRYKDLNEDGIIDSENDRKIIGSSIPDFTWNLSNTLSYKGLSLSFYFQGVHGVDIYNSLRSLTESPNSGNSSAVLLNAWDGERPSNTIPRLLITDPNNNMRTSTRFLESGDYIRLKNVRIAYNLPSLMIKKVGMKQCQLYVTGTNLLTFTDYSGYDPEIGLRSGGDNETAGVDFGTYPNTRQYTLGVKITF